MTVWQPETDAQVTEIIRSAVADQCPLRVCGHDTKSGFGAPVDTTDILSFKSISGVIDYQPEELVLVVKAGTPLTEIEQLLSAQNQMLAFEPPHLDKFYKSDGTGTIGGVIAANLSGPRRVSAGAARDYLLGFSAVSGRGDEFKSGSRVMKNVTGYDLSKLMCGSFGTLAAMTDITLKVLPRPETSSSLSVRCETLAAAQAVLSSAFCTETEPSGGAVVKTESGWQAVIRLEGVDVSVRDRMSNLKAVLSAQGELSILDLPESEAFWEGWRDVSMMPVEAEQVFKLSVVPSCAPSLLDSLMATYDVHAGLDWAGGLIWLGGEGDELCASIRQAVEACGGGHATLMRAPEQQRREQAVFHPQPASLAALSDRIKISFDPQRILSPGKMDERNGKA